MLTEKTNKELNTDPLNPEAEIATEEPAPEEPGKGTWREDFRAAFDSTAAAETGGEPAGTRARQEQVAFLADRSLRGAAAALPWVLLPPDAKDFASRRKPARRSQSGTQSYTGTGEQRSYQSGYSDAECGCAFPRSSAGWPIDGGRYWPDLTNRHGAQANCICDQDQTPRRITRLARSISLTLPWDRAQPPPIRRQRPLRSRHRTHLPI